MGNGINGELDEDRLSLTRLLLVRDLCWRSVFYLHPTALDNIRWRYGICISGLSHHRRGGRGSKHNTAEKTHDGPRAVGPRRMGMSISGPSLFDGESAMRAGGLGLLRAEGDAGGIRLS